MNAHEQISEPDYSNIFSWGAFHASKTNQAPTPGLQAMLPLFDEKSTLPGMIKHGMDLVKRITQYLNPGQTPVLCMDQQLYLLAKKLQWMKPATYGEERLVMLMGGFHIEKVILSILGQLLEKSGYVYVVAASAITTAGSAEGCLKVMEPEISVTPRGLVWGSFLNFPGFPRIASSGVAPENSRCIAFIAPGRLRGA